MTDTTLFIDDQIANAIVDFKLALREFGFQTANAVGELKNANGTVWVSTTCTHAQVRVQMWLRPRGYGNPLQRCYVEYNSATGIDFLPLLTFLSKWAHKQNTTKKWAWPFEGAQMSYPQYAE